MSIEPKRGCGFRRAGGLYLVSGALARPCCRLPLELSTCPCCGEGIRQQRGFRWVDPGRLFAKCPPPRCDTFPAHIGSRDFAGPGTCPFFAPSRMGERAGLMWVGASFYATPAHFNAEARMLGVSKRIASVPRDFVVGETWVLLAHPSACPVRNVEPIIGNTWPGVFAAFRPDRIEKLIKQSQATPEALEALEKRGITPVIVPDNDPDHCDGVDVEGADLFAEERN